MSTLCLNCDSTIRMTISASDSAADVSGRRSSASQKKLSMPQVRTKAACAAGSDSDAEQHAECREVNGGEERNPGGISKVGGREAALQVAGRRAA